MLDSDLKLYKSLVNTDTSSNGGRVGYTEIVDNVLNNAFPSLTPEERAAGGSRLRKLFFRNINSAEEALANARMCIMYPSTAEDLFVLIEGTQVDTQGDLTGTEKEHACGTLNAGASAGATTIVVNFEDAAHTDLEDGDLLWIAKLTRASESDPWTVAASMFNTVDVSGVSWAGNQATIQLVDELNTDYPAGGSGNT